jgi:hypothetical protein
MRKAKVVRAREDVQALGSAIAMFITDTANSYFLIDGSPGVTPEQGASRGEEVTTGGAPNQESGNRVDMLVTDGDIPELVTQAVEPSANDNTQWREPVNYSTVDFFEYHLVTNTPGNNINNAYRVPTDYTYAPTGNTGNGDTNSATATDPGFARNESAGFNSEFSWRGPYMTGPIDPYPWGNRYMSNVRFLDPIADSKNDDSWDNAAGADGGTIGQLTGQGTAVIIGAGFTNDCIVLSAGPDEEVDTGWNLSNDQHTTTNGQHDNNTTPGDDDIIYTVSGNSRP